jgi:sugar O-acyltransferase (sialic acid O-acetyltransferase NeuD family)
MKRLIIAGAGDLGQLIAYHAIHDNHFEVVGFLDDFTEPNSKISELLVLGNLNDGIQLFENDYFDFIIIGIGYKHMKFRKSLFQQYKDKIPFATIIHSSVFIDKSVKVGKGTFILPGCVIDRGCEIGENVLLNTGVIIAHDSKIDEHCFLAPAVQIAGKVRISESCIIGIGTTIIDNIIIHPYIQLGGGAVVIDNLEKSGLYVGVPAKMKKHFI